jgi:hypothetical protein
MDKSIIRRANWIDAATSSRPVRSTRWGARAFFAFPCAFLLDVPLDMTGVIHGALRAASEAGLHRPPDGDVLVTDRMQRGAILVEIEDDHRVSAVQASLARGANIVRVESTELLVREVPTRPSRLRAELDELVRWSRELGHEVSAVYVRYDLSDRSARPREMFAALRGEPSLDSPRVERAG